MKEIAEAYVLSGGRGESGLCPISAIYPQLQGGLEICPNGPEFSGRNRARRRPRTRPENAGDERREHDGPRAAPARHEFPGSPLTVRWTVPGPAGAARPAPRRRRSSAAGHCGRRANRHSGRRYEMKKITIRKAGPVRLTAAACGVYKKKPA
ncbi:hypothetical protein Skr01_73210 [Sphaerisporangium krabiense]|nr:hypothetical protein Skr01_73210 [Sphaerisporangium krabiense]